MDGSRTLIGQGTFGKGTRRCSLVLAEAATALDISLEDIFQANIDKLKMRYPDGFETKKSLVRLKVDI